MHFSYCLEFSEYPSSNVIHEIRLILLEYLKLEGIKLKNDIYIDVEIPNMELTEQMVKDGIMTQEDYEDGITQHKSLITNLNELSQK